MDQCTLGAGRIAGLHSGHVAKPKDFLRDYIIIISSAAKLVGDSHNYMRGGGRSGIFIRLSLAAPQG